MSFGPNNTLGNFLAENFVIPKDDQYDIFLKRTLEDHARFINRKDTGSYDLVEQLINQQYFGTTPQQKRQVYRKVFSFGAIGVGATLNIVHNITQVTIYTRVYGCCITAADFRPIPYVSVAAANQGIELRVNAANIVIINGAAAPAINSGIIVLEFLKI